MLRGSLRFVNRWCDTRSRPITACHASGLSKRHARQADDQLGRLRQGQIRRGADGWNQDARLDAAGAAETRDVSAAAQACTWRFSQNFAVQWLLSCAHRSMRYLTQCEEREYFILLRAIFAQLDDDRMCYRVTYTYWP
jgi:hypothetical protein